MKHFVGSQNNRYTGGHRHSVNKMAYNLADIVEQHPLCLDRQEGATNSDNQESWDTNSPEESGLNWLADPIVAVNQQDVDEDDNMGQYRDVGVNQREAFVEGCLPGRFRVEAVIAEPSRGGYEYQFVETPPDMFVCKICHHPSREPYLSVCCGHTFCKSCLDGAMLCFSCPMCREQPFTTVPNKQNERAIKSRHVFCINREKGCHWQGELSAVSDHLENSTGCQFEDVICPNQCGTTFERWYLQDHTRTCPRRTTDCQYCGIAGEYQLIEGEHKETCPKFPLSCPNSCGVSKIFRENVKNHRNTCPLEEINCFHECGTVLQRQNLTSHIEAECPRREVECQYCHVKGEHQFIEGNHKEECPKFPLPCPNACEVFNMPRKDMKEHRKICPLEVVQCEYYSVGCEAKIVRKNQKAHEKENMEGHLLFTKSKLACLESVFEAKLKMLETQLEQKTQFINDMLFKNVFWVKTLTAQAHTSSGVINNKSLPLILKISDYTKHTKESITCTVEHYIKHPATSKSRYYSSANNPIHLQLYLSPAGRGDGEGSHLSVHFRATNIRSRILTTTIREVDNI